MHHVFTQGFEKEKLMTRSITSKNRKELENKLAKVFAKDMQTLPPGFKKIMVSDLVSAFESRISALKRVQSNVDFEVINENRVEVETA